MAAFFKKRSSNRSGSKTIIDNIEFDSKLEAYFYTKFKQKTRLELKQVISIIPSFEYIGEKIRSLTWTPDFYLPEYDTYIETKGFPNESFPLRLKLAKYKFYKSGVKTKILVLTNKKSIDFLYENLEKLNNLDFNVSRFQKFESQLKN